MIVTRNFRIQTKGNSDVIDITREVERALAESKLVSGTVTVFVTHSTVGITTIENEPGLVNDFKNLWERLVPESERYQHDSGSIEGNGHSHVRASLLGASLVVPFQERRLLLGTWQQIVLIDFDNRPRSRNIVLQVMGE
jgi:secondary thiamine-phosphate synthase enzyme